MTKLLPGELENLLKQDGASQVVLVTTMWNTTQAEVAEGREEQLHTLWKDMLELGAQTDRFDNREEKAWEIVRQLLARDVGECHAKQSLLP